MVAVARRYETVEAPRQTLQRIETRANQGLQGAHRTFDRLGQLRREVRELAGQLDRDLGRLYRPEAMAEVRRKLWRIVRQDGWRRASWTLASVGRLRYGRLARLKPALQAETRGTARVAADRLGRLSGVRRQIRELRGEVRVARLANSPARIRALRAVRLLRRLSSHRLLQNTLVRAASRVGLEAAGFVLAPTPWKMVRLALRMARGAKRAMER